MTKRSDPVVQPLQVPGEGLAHPILTDVRVRRAIAHCTNRDALAASVFGYLSPTQRQPLFMDTFVLKEHWAYSAPPVAFIYPFDPTLGGQFLDQAGWTLAAGATFRTNAAGQELKLQYLSTNASFTQTWAAVLESNLRDCGIRLIRNHVPGSVFFGANSGLRRRDFELASFAWVGQVEPGGSQYTCDQIPTPANNWLGSNYMGWCNVTASNTLERANRTLLRADRIADYGVAQTAFAEDMVSLPLFRRPSVYATHKDFTGYAPNGVDPYTWNAYQWSVPATTTIVMGLTQEPASLFPLVESSAAASLVAQLIYGTGVSHVNFDYQPRLYASLPTIENGGAVTRTVNVTTGTVVVDVSGNVGALANGMLVLNGAGEEVVYSGSALTMTQMVITGTFLSGMNWSDGSPLVMADLQLWDNINCDPSSGAFDFTRCERTASREYLNNTTARYTLVPGYLPQDYLMILPGAYPSERLLSDGRRLKDVPAAQWRNLPEIKDSPMGFGPYRLTQWQKGQRMLFTANPSFILGVPLMPNLEIRFIASSSQATAELIAGTIHVLGAETGADATTLLTADQNGQIKAYVVASGTWEHLDTDSLTDFMKPLR